MATKKEKEVKLTEKEVKIVKEALSSAKTFKQLGMSKEQGQRREEKISDIYDIETIEKKLD